VTGGARHAAAGVRRGRGPDLLAVAALLVLAGKLVIGVAGFRDLPGADENYYETSGVRLLWALRAHETLPRPPADWAPLYSTWYAALATVCPDPARLFDVSWALLVLLFTVALYALARRLGQTPTTSVATATALLATGFFHIGPFPSLLYLAMLLLGALAASTCTTSLSRASVIAATFGCAVFVRPEAAVAYFASVVALVVAAARPTRPRSAAAHAALALGPPAALAMAFGNPLAGTRAFDAFAQHYAFTLTRREHLPGDPWMNFSGLVRRDFGDVTTVWQAMTANPRALLAHALYNARELPSNVLDLCAVRTGLAGPSSPLVQGLSAVVVVAAVAALALRLRRRAAPVTGPGAVVTAGATVVFALACASAAPGVLLVFPRAHYLVAPCALGWLLATTEAFARLRGRFPAARWVAPSSWLRAASALAVATVLWLVVPAAWQSPPPPQPVRRAAAWLRSAHLTRVPVFSAGADIATLAGYDFPVVSGWGKNEPLLDLLAREGIGLFTLEDRMLGRERLAADPQVHAFLQDPVSSGFCEGYREPGFLRVFVGAGALPPGGCRALPPAKP
jgi:hypothetical protein